MNEKLKFSGLRGKFFINGYFLGFIFLNIFDFFNFLSADLDFFKKLLSWFLIGLLFYKISLSKIFIGTRNKLLDLVFIIGFSFFSVIRELILYTTKSITNQSGFYESSNFIFFNLILDPISNLNPNSFLLISFLVGILITIITSTILLNISEVKKHSLVGSFNLSEYMKFMKIEYLILIISATFFGLIVFNFFMEWFALAIDSAILVIGLLFYSYQLLIKNRQNSLTNFFSNISNSGSDFYKKLILSFSNKNTFFFGVAFLLVLHPIVDGAVFMIPHTIGIENPLYFASLENSEIDTHKPIFNFLDFENSYFADSFNLISSGLLYSFFFVFLSFIIYFSMIFLFTSFLVLPFFIFYKHIQKRKVIFNIWFLKSFFISLTLLISLVLISGMSSPISFEKISENSLTGVDILTSSFVDSVSLDFKLDILKQITLLIILIISTFLFVLKFDLNNVFFKNLLLILVLAFFLFYMNLYLSSIFESQISRLNFNEKSDFMKISSNFEKYNLVDSSFRNSSLFKSRIVIKFVNIGNFTMIPFSDQSFMQIKNGNLHYDYLSISFGGLNKKSSLLFSNSSSAIFAESLISKNGLTLENGSFYYFLGEGFFKFEDGKVNLGLDSKKVSSIFKIVPKQTNLSILIANIVNISNNFFKYLNLLFSFIFYLFGIIFFIYYYIIFNFFKKY